MGMLLILPCLLLIRPLMHGAIPWFMDPLMYFYPLRVHAAHLLAQGEWPWWNRCLMGGMPLFENPQAALAYPLNWPMLVWPGGFWFTFPMILQMGLYGALTYWAVRRLAPRAGWMPAVWAGLLALAGGYGWSRLQYGNYLNAMPWWGLWVGAIVGYCRPRCFTGKEIGAYRWLVLGSLAIGLMLLAGAHQLVFYFLVFTACFWIGGLTLDHGRRLRWLQFGLSCWVLGLLIGALGWLPQVGFLRETGRAGGVEIEAVLAGTIHSLNELIGALAGLEYVSWTGRAPWADAELSAWLGPLALALAFVAPASLRRRQAWLGLWLGVFVLVLLSTEMVNRFVLNLHPAFGLFHAPRRVLGVVQWILIILSALGWIALIDSGERRLRRCGPAWMRYEPWLSIAVLLGLSFFFVQDRLLLGMIMFNAIALLIVILSQVATIRQVALVLFFLNIIQVAHQTWTWTDLKAINPDTLFNTEPLLSEAGLRPGQRYLTTDWQRSYSYGYERPDIVEWMLPNLGMIWGYEDIGGYEPAQSRRYRKFMDSLHDSLPGRRLWPNHFGIVQATTQRDLLNAANVHSALMPRWGQPFYFDQGVSHFVPILANGARLVALSSNKEANELTLYAIQQAGPERAGAFRPLARLNSPHPLSMRDDLVVPEQAALSRTEPLGAGWMIRYRGVWPGEFAADALAVDAVPDQGYFNLFGWDTGHAQLWQPIHIGPTAALMEYRGSPSRYHWLEGEGRVLDERIHANRLELEVDVNSTEGAQLLVHDAWWPGWRAFVNGESVVCSPAGLWREVSLPSGRSTVVMSYRPALVSVSLVLSGVGLLILLSLGLMMRRRSRPVPGTERELAL